MAKQFRNQMNWKPKMKKEASQKQPKNKNNTRKQVVTFIS